MHSHAPEGAEGGAAMAEGAVGLYKKQKEQARKADAGGVVRAVRVWGQGSGSGFRGQGC